MVRPFAPAVWAAMFVILCGVPGSASCADEDAAQAISGRGMHAYFAGDTSAAEDLFTQAIATGTQDPRTYYFRGACRMQQEREDEARDDIRRGAYLETHSEGRFYDIGHSLERVQGKARVMIEQARDTARRAAIEARERYRHERYRQMQATETDVLLKPVPTRPLVDISSDAVGSARQAIHIDPLAVIPAELPQASTPSESTPAESAPAEPSADATGESDVAPVPLSVLGSLFSRALTGGEAGSQTKALEGTLRKAAELVGGLGGPGAVDGP